MDDDADRTQRAAPSDRPRGDVVLNPLPEVVSLDATLPEPPAFSDDRSKTFRVSATSKPEASKGAFDAPTVEAPTRRAPPVLRPSIHDRSDGRWGDAKASLGAFVDKHHRKLWWLHTCYALSLGLFVATLAQRGFEHARFLTLSLGFVWVLVVLFFRFFGTGAQQDFITAFPGARRRFFIMTYLMKNLFQGMLFFLLPLYYRSSSSSAHTIAIVYLLGGCAVLSTLDLVFDRVLLRYKIVASLFFAVTLFGCMNVAIPALLPSMPTLPILLVSGGLAIATFFLFHVPLVWLKRPLAVGVLVGAIAGGVLAFYFGRTAFPAVPMYVKGGGVGPSVGDDGTLDYQVNVVRADALGDLYAVTDVAVVDEGEHLVHVWRHDGAEIAHAGVDKVAPPKEAHIVRVASRIDGRKLGTKPVGRFTVDVETDSGQIVGRVAFDVRP